MWTEDGGQKVPQLWRLLALSSPGRLGKGVAKPALCSLCCPYPTHPQECGWPESGGLGPSPLPTTSQYGALTSRGLAVHPPSATVVTALCLPREGARPPSPCLTDGKWRASWQVGDLAHAEKSLPARDPGTWEPGPQGSLQRPLTRLLGLIPLGEKAGPKGTRTVSKTQRSQEAKACISAAAPQVDNLSGSEHSLGRDTGQRTGWPGRPLGQASTGVPVSHSATPGRRAGPFMFPPLPAVFPEASRSGQVPVHSYVTVMGGLGSRSQGPRCS